MADKNEITNSQRPDTGASSLRELEGRADGLAPPRSVLSSKPEPKGSQPEIFSSNCDECGHPLEAHGRDGCKIERQTGEPGFEADGPCGCEAVTWEPFEPPKSGERLQLANASPDGVDRDFDFEELHPEYDPALDEIESECAIETNGK